MLSRSTKFALVLALLAGGGLVFVVASAFITSYQHQHALLVEYGNPQTSATLLPLAVDALILMASVSLAVIAERRRALAAPAQVIEVNSSVSDTVSDTGSPAEQPERQVRRTPRKATTADKVAVARKRTPDASAADIARRLKVSERTVARHLAALNPVPVFVDAVSDTSPHNGSTVSLPV